MPSRCLLCPDGDGNLLADSPVKRQKRFPSTLWKFQQRFTGLLWAETFRLSAVMRDGRCRHRGRFPRTRLSGSRLSWPTLAKAKSSWCRHSIGEKKNWLTPLGRTAAQGCWLLPWSPGSYRQQMFCYIAPVNMLADKSPTYRLGCGNVGMAVVSRERGGL